MCPRTREQYCECVCECAYMCAQILMQTVAYLEEWHYYIVISLIELFIR